MFLTFKSQANKYFFPSNHSQPFIMNLHSSDKTVLTNLGAKQIKSQQIEE